MRPESCGLKPLARLVSYAPAGVDPKYMGIGPIPATRKALERAGLSVGDLDVIEANEAFAAQACAVSKELALDPAKVNPNGSGISLGHPIGATGALITVKAVVRTAARGRTVRAGDNVHWRRAAALLLAGCNSAMPPDGSRAVSAARAAVKPGDLGLQAPGTAEAETLALPPAKPLTPNPAYAHFPTYVGTLGDKQIEMKLGAKTDEHTRVHGEYRFAGASTVILVAKGPRWRYARDRRVE